MSRLIVRDVLATSRCRSLDPIVKTRLHSSSRHILNTLFIPRTSSLPRQDTIAVMVRHTTALITVPRLPLVQPLGGLRLSMSLWAEDGRDSRTIRLPLTCRYHLHHVTCARHIQHIPLRRASHNINPPQALLTQQGVVHLMALPLQLHQPIRTINSLWQ